MTKSKHLFIPIVASLGLTLTSVMVKTQQGVNKNYSALHADKQFEEEGENFKGAAEWSKLIRANQITGEVDPQDVYNARLQANLLAQSKKTRAFDQMKWTERGSNNIGGRTRALLVDKNDNNKLFMGGVSGGLWKSLDNGDNWSKVLGTDTTTAVSICSITQAANGDIYYGTGEGNYIGSGEFGRGQLGEGIWKSTDGGNTFVQLASTIPANGNINSDAWSFVDKLVASPTNPNLIIAATNGGLKVTQDGGATWAKPAGLTINARFNDVEISSDGNRVVATTSNGIYVSDDAGASFGANKLNGTAGLPASSGISRTEVAIAPSNSDYIYAVTVTSTTSQLKGVYKSTDGGANWTTIGVGGSAIFDPLGNQGTYNIALGVHPTNPEMIFLGGQLDLWRYTPSSLWGAIAYWQGSAFSGTRVHADMHGIVFNPSNPENMFVICDGGIYKTVNASATNPFFAEKNKNYNVVQCYGIGANRLGHIIYGSQDNGSGLIGKNVNSANEARDLTGGDGTRCALSDINTNYVFSSIVQGDLRRANDGGASSVSFKSFFDKNIDNDDDGSPDENASWVAPIVFDERVDDGVHKSIFLFGAKNSVWMTQGAVASKTIWFKIASQSNAFYSSLCMTKDGKTVYAGTQGGLIYRYDVPSLWDSTYKYYDTITNEFGTLGFPYSSLISGQQIANYGRIITDLACDNSGNTLVVTIGNYGNTSYVTKSNNAKSATPTFSNITSNLPKMPVYSVVAVGGSSLKYIIGTEMGLYGTDNGGTSWTDLNMMSSDPNEWHPRVATYEVIEKPILETSSGTFVGAVIYSGTHGRGTFQSTSLANTFWPTSVNNIDKGIKQIKIYPNPATNQITVDLGTEFSGRTSLKVFSLTGSMLKSITLDGVYSKTQMNVADLPAGAYIIYATNGAQKSTNTFVKQ